MEIKYQIIMNDLPICYELHIQIPDELSPIKTTINLECFTYTELDFKKIERHAKKLIKLLVAEPLVISGFLPK